MVAVETEVAAVMEVDKVANMVVEVVVVVTEMVLKHNNMYCIERTPVLKIQHFLFVNSKTSQNICLPGWWLQYNALVQ